MAPGQQLINGAIDRRGGDRERAATRTKDGHAGDLSQHIDQSAALAGWMNRNVKPDQAVDRAAATTVPGPAGQRDDAERRERSTFMISDRQGDLAGTQRSI